jgi:SPP1 gp7 family putative phage head morphogenesis protein
MPDGAVAFAEPQPGAVPFDEAIAFFRAKLNLPTRTWTDLWQDQHAAAFSVAGAMKADLIQDLRNAVDRALADGTTLEDFRRDFAAIVKRSGWSYRGSFEWRTRTILETNLRMAYAAGKWQQAQATAEDFPYLRYVAVLDDRTRPDHRRWHGTILPVGHAWWRTHYPPNGWGCRCTVQQVNERDLKRRGWRVQPEAPRDPLVSKPVRDIDGTRTVQVPRGIDPGFAYNVGEGRQGLPAAQQAARQVALKYADLDPALGAVFAQAASVVERAARAEEFRAWAGALQAAGFPDDKTFRVVGALSPGTVARLAERNLAPSSASIAITAKRLGHAMRESKAARGAAIAEADLLRLPELIEAPIAVLRQTEGPPRLLLVFDPADTARAVLGKIVVALDVYLDVRDAPKAKRAKRRMNSVWTAGLVQPGNLRDPGRYEVIEGGL